MSKKNELNSKKNILLSFLAVNKYKFDLVYHYLLIRLGQIGLDSQDSVRTVCEMVHKKSFIQY